MMIYAAELLRKHGRYSRIWLAATCMSAFRKHATRRQIINMNLIEICDDLDSRITTESQCVEERLSLYLSSELIYGICRVFELQICYLRDDILHILPKHRKVVITDVRKRQGETMGENDNIVGKKSKTTKEISVAATNYLPEFQPITLEEMEKALAAHTIQDPATITLKEIVNVVEEEMFLADDMPLDLNQMESMLGMAEPDLLPAVEHNTEALINNTNIIEVPPQQREFIDQQKGDSVDITSLALLSRPEEPAGGDVQSITAPPILHKDATTPTKLPAAARKSVITDDGLRQAILDQTPADNEATKMQQDAVNIPDQTPIIEQAEETLNRHKRLAQTLPEIHLESTLNLSKDRRVKAKRKLIFDKKTGIPSDYIRAYIQPLVHLRCQNSSEDIAVPKRKFKILPEDLFKQPSHKFYIKELKSLFVPITKPQTSSEMTILNKILGIEISDTTTSVGMASATASNIRDNTGNITSLGQSNTRLEKAIEDKTPLIPEPALITPEIVPLPMEEVVPAFSTTPKAAPRPDVLEEIVEHSTADHFQMREQWGKVATMKKLKSLWLKKIRPITMHTLCNPNDNNRLAAATCFRSILDLIAGGMVTVKKEGTTIIDIRPGSMIIKHKRQLFKEGAETSE